MNIDIIVTILDLASKYGVTFVKDLIETWGKNEITLEDIEALKTKLKSPEKYAKEAEELKSKA